MPKRREAWSAWNVLERDGHVHVTYWMNKLQPLPTDKNIFVTLNPNAPLKDTFGTFAYDHPLFDQDSGAAQRDIWHVQGRDGLWFCGAHLGAGFHEDGIAAGLAVADMIGGFQRPWPVEDAYARLHIPVAIREQIKSYARV